MLELKGGGGGVETAKKGGVRGLSGMRMRRKVS